MMSCWNEVITVLSILNFMSFKASSTLFCIFCILVGEEVWFCRYKMMLRDSPVPFKLMLSILFLFPSSSPPSAASFLLQQIFWNTVFEMTAWLLTEKKKKEFDGNLSCSHTVPSLAIYYHIYKPRILHPVLNHSQEEHVNKQQKTMPKLKILGLKWRIFRGNKTVDCTSHTTYFLKLKVELKKYE